ncbi:MAG: FecR domain-containing protein [Bacteroidales bacterium]|nr:FecR domain-containing protein [Bacteroidales bacterium]
MEDLFKKLKELMLLGDIGGDELSSRYRTYSETDEEKALADFRCRIAAGNGKAASTASLKWICYAAAAAVVILISTIALLLHRPGDGKPTLSQDTRLAMEQSGKSGKQEAGVTVLTEDALAKAVRANAANAETFASARRVTTEQTKEYWLTLDDGSVIHLNNDTYLIYPERNDARTREVILDGEAYFTVAKEASRPFIVHTKRGDIRVYGTEFNVSTREAGGTTEVVLVEGSVSITPTGGAERRIEPGQKATIGRTMTVESVDVEQYVAWNTGRFAFKDWPLGKVLEVICRWYGVSVSYADESLSRPKISGNFDRYEDLSTTIESLSTVTGLQFDLSEDNLFIHRP